MQYDPTIEKAPPGKFRIIILTRFDGEFYFEIYDDYRSLARAFARITLLGSWEDKLSRQHRVCGIFDEKGAVWIQYPSWSPNPWEGDRIWQVAPR